MACVSVFGGAGAYVARAENAAAFPSEPKRTAAAVQRKIGDELIRPSSYEQYLPLTKPADVAVTQNYTAIADGSFIYIYNRAENEYSRYEHTANADASKNSIAKLQFSESDFLYFLDASTYLYTLDPLTLECVKTDLVCSTFAIFSGDIYFTNVSTTISQISKTTLNRLDSSAAEPVVGSITSKPVIAQDNGVLYYTEAGKYLHKAGDSSLNLWLTESETVVSLAVYNGLLYYTDTAKNLYVRNVSSGALLASFEGGYSALSVYAGYLYVIKNKSVKQYSPAESRFTDYEICDSSDSDNRLSDASELSLCGDKLFAIDRGNDRISVYDTLTGNSFILPSVSNTSTVSSDGKTVLTASVSKAKLYSLDGEDEGTTFDGFNGNLVGSAAVYGKYYLVSDSGYYYCIEETEEGRTINGRQKQFSSYSPKLLSSDIYGNLYVAYSDGSVYRFTEDEFLNVSFTEEKIKEKYICHIPAQSRKLAVDYEGTVYSLYNNELVSYGTVQMKYPLSKSPVYSGESSPTAVSFAFGAEDKAVYVLYDGNFILRTYDIDLPTMNTIPVNGADENIFSSESAAFSVVRTPKNTLMINFDIERLDGAEVFPYLSYKRETEEKIALKLGETDKYNLIAVFDERTKTYSTALILKGEPYCTEIPREEFLKPAEDFGEGNGYLSNAIALYKFPYLTRLLTVCELDKNAEVTVLGEIDALDYHYYYVSYTDSEGRERTGYVPQAYVTNFNGAPPESTVISYGAEAADHDSLWRMAFLLLGCASICVLVDYLILHKRK